MKVKIVSKSGGKIPEYMTAGSAGVDISAILDSPVILGPLERALIPTGMFIEIPRGYEAQIRPRSGMAINHGITLINCIGTIDSDYRGEVKIPVVNLSNVTFTINSGDRIAQMVFSKYENAEFVEVYEINDLTETARKDGGFGSTGFKEKE